MVQLLEHDQTAQHNSLRRRVLEIIEPAGRGGRASRVFGLIILSLIALNVLAVVLESVEDFSARFGPALRLFEIISVIVFTAEYLLRLWACTAHPRFSRPLLGRLRFMLTPMAIVDLLAILPFYLPMLLLDLRFARAVRLMRLFRILKVTRYSRSLRLLGNVLRQRRADLVVTGGVVAILLLVASSLMYFAEHDAQPNAFSSIPAAMWWGIVTLTTVGYGDIYPITPLGKLLGAVIAILGVGFVALPAGLLSSGFVEEMQRTRRSATCPHCGKPLAADENHAE